MGAKGSDSPLPCPPLKMGACFSSPAAPSQRNGINDSKLDLTRPASLAVGAKEAGPQARPAAVIGARSSPKVGAKLEEASCSASDDDAGKCAAATTTAVVLQEMEALVTKVCCVFVCVVRRKSPYLGWRALDWQSMCRPIVDATHSNPGTPSPSTCPPKTQVNALTQSLAMTSTHPLIALPEAAELLATALEADVVGCALFLCVCMHIIAHGACACACGSLKNS